MDSIITKINGKWAMVQNKKNGKILLEKEDGETFKDFEDRCAEYSKPKKKKKKTVRFKKWDCKLVWGKYGNGHFALELVDVLDGSPVAVATVNLPSQNLEHNEVFIKDYSENEGMLDALVQAGIVEDTGRRVTTGYVTVPVCRVIVSQN